MCGFAHYSARYVYGKPAYRYAETQSPWFDRKMRDYADRLQEVIKAGRRKEEQPLFKS